MNNIKKTGAVSLLVLMLVSLSSCCCKRKTAASIQIEDVASGSIILKAEVPAGTTWAAVESDYDRENILSIEGELLYKTGSSLAENPLTDENNAVVKTSDEVADGMLYEFPNWH